MSNANITSGRIHVVLTYFDLMALTFSQYERAGFWGWSVDLVGSINKWIVVFFGCIVSTSSLFYPKSKNRSFTSMRSVFQLVVPCNCWLSLLMRWWLLADCSNLSRSWDACSKKESLCHPPQRFWERLPLQCEETRHRLWILQMMKICGSMYSISCQVWVG